ncbi:type I secretion system ABC transporter, PrtD family [Loktanella sp. DSM 29012]|uniref:type I secretion system permease/ATPase n=1 Tax=Loktanella sp. DSM 29012 TaxID=1881056 RepID=UPI0008C0CA0A|nr:type I secretion system permease/ATPase [Loktanella sp. DSM 29012]SEQ74403.1 type I secretion system ABC transporter, PrtD family [Loktanella sp. DSM 29012]
MQAFEQLRRAGRTELRAVYREALPLCWVVGLFSLVVNMLMLAGPIYMLNVYDRVLGSRSLETLVALTILVAFLYAMMGLLDVMRGRIMMRLAALFQTRLDRRVFDAVLQANASQPASLQGQAGLRDLDAVQRLIASPALLSAFDLPWMPLFFLGIFVFHPLLGSLALAGCAALIGVAVINRCVTRAPLSTAQAARHEAETQCAYIHNASQVIQAMGMRDDSHARWQAARDRALDAGLIAAQTSSTCTGVIKTLRLFLQSAMLGLGAYLVLRGELTPGGMIAGSILMARALLPVEQIVAQWTVFQQGRAAWQNLSVLLGVNPVPHRRMCLPPPRADVLVDQITVVPPGAHQAVLRMVSFAVAPGQAVGVIGASGAGKSALARALTGVWRPAGGTIRLGDAALDQYDTDVLGRHIGYLPQQVQLCDGTIRDNIARMSMQPDDAAVVTAARKAGAHDMILRLPGGYDTRVATSGGKLSGGQIQRIGLARALYGAPVLLVLDEPNSNLDDDGSAALNMAIRSAKTAGKAVFIMAHRPAAIQECDLLLVLEGGACRAFGPKDSVMRKVLHNARDIQPLPAKAAGIP